VRGEVFMPLAGSERMNSAAAAAGEKGIRQPAQCRGRQPAPARSAGDGEAAAGGFFYARRAVAAGRAPGEPDRAAGKQLDAWGLRTCPEIGVCAASRLPRLLPFHRRAPRAL
jgi:hypothetical protein